MALNKGFTAPIVMALGGWKTVVLDDEDQLKPAKKSRKKPVSGSLRTALYSPPSDNSTGDESRWTQVAIIRDSG